MDNRKNIEQELQSLRSSLSAGQPAGFSVPTGYFENFAASVLGKIKASEADAAAEISSLSPLLAGISRQMPYQLPPQYFFDTIEGLTAITGDVIPLWKDEQRLTPYEAPSAYFQQLPGQILAKLTKQAKVVPMFKRKWVRMAVAASVAGLISLAGMFYFTSKPVPVNSPEWVAKNIKNVSINDLDEFVQTTSVNLNSGETAQAPRLDLKPMLQGVTDKDIDAFLNQVSEDDAAVN